MKIALCIAVAGLAAAANADITPLTAFNLNTAQISGGNLLSVGVSGTQSVIPGDTFTSEPLVQTSTGAFFSDDGAGSIFVFGTQGVGGNNVTNPGTVSVVNSAQINNPNGTFTVAASVAHLDSTGALALWVAQGVTGPNAAPLVVWRYDVGAVAGGTDQIDIALGAGQFINVLSANVLVFNTAGSVLATFPLPAGNNFSTTSSLAGIGIVGLGGANIAGFNLSGMEIQWTYEVVPSPAPAAILGFAGLAAARRRR